MSKREQKWSKKYSAVLVGNHGDEVRLGCGQLGLSVKPAQYSNYRLIYRNPDARWDIMADWVRNAPLHPDYFGYQEPLAVGDWVHMTECFELGCDMTGYVHSIDHGGDAWINRITGRKPAAWEGYVDLCIPRVPRKGYRFVRTAQPADSTPPAFKPTLCEKLKGKPGWTDSFGCPIPEHDFGVATDGPDGDGVYYVHWFKDGKCTGERYCAPDALEAL